MPIVIAPLGEAIRYHDRKTPIGTALRSAALEEVPRELWNSAQMSAGVESARVLQRIQDGIGGILRHSRSELGGLANRTQFISDLSALAESEGLRPKEEGKRGTIEDVTGYQRLSLIYEMQTGMAYGYANWKIGNDPDLIEAFPAQELVRVREAKVPRNWRVRWEAAGGEVGWEGAKRSPMVALKSSPIWRKLSRFEKPWPPFDYNSGMWVEDVSWEEAERLGLVARGEKAQPQDQSLLDQTDVSVESLSTELRGKLEEHFDGQVEIRNGRLRWIEPAGPPGVAGAEPEHPEVALTPVDLNPAAPEVRFERWEDGKAWADERLHPLKMGLSKPQIKTLQQAQRGTQEVNGKLWRVEDLTKDEEAFIERLGRLTGEQAQALPNMVLHRYGSEREWTRYGVGQTVTLAGFTSLTMAPSADVKRKYGKGAHIVFRIKAGTRGMYMDRVSGDPQYDSEAEILLRAGTRVAIRSKVLQDGVWQITVDVL